MISPAATRPACSSTNSVPSAISTTPASVFHGLDLNQIFSTKVEFRRGGQIESLFCKNTFLGSSVCGKAGAGGEEGEHAFDYTSVWVVVHGLTEDVRGMAASLPWAIRESPLQ